jgi:hypothetical protein
LHSKTVEIAFAALVLPLRESHDPEQTGVNLIACVAVQVNARMPFVRSGVAV